MRRPLLVVVATQIFLTGCVRESSNRSAACAWHESDGVKSERLPPGHLTKDAEEAEDIAIQYADGWSRPGSSGHTMAEYVQTQDSCMATLFQVIANRHHVSADTVRNSINKNRNRLLDTLVVLSFGVIYLIVVNALTRRIWLRFPPHHGWVAGALATLFISTITSFIGVFFGEMWSFEAEAVRIGYGHLSYRALRIPWYQHEVGIFAAGLILFWILASVRFRAVGTTAPSKQTIYGL